jgi:sodium-dependent dicarboxylate transporter 2/3/5
MSAVPPPAPPPDRVARAGQLLGPLLGLAVAWGAPLPAAEAGAAGGALWMAVWWLTEAVPMGITALLPLVLWPLWGVQPGGAPAALVQTASAFTNAYLFLFLGGMVLGLAMEETGLHRRVALHILARVGGAPERLVLGVLVATAAVSMWISNTATAVMMTPIAGALAGRLEAQAGRRLLGFSTALLLGVAWGANLGGIGTKIGSGTNSIFCGFVADRLGVELGFLAYSWLCLPFLLLVLPVAWGLLWTAASVDRAHLTPVPVRDQLDAIGSAGRSERLVAAAFGAAALLWVLGDAVRPGLVSIVGPSWKARHWEAAVALTAGAVPLVLGILPWSRIARLPWGALALLGGSFAMAEGIEVSGLSARLAEALSGLGGQPLAIQAGVAATAAIGLSAVASNTATVNVLLQVVPPTLPVLAVTAMGASCDFALPAGTPPNAIVFGTGGVRLREMVRLGVVLDAFCAVALAGYAALWLA